MIARAAFGRVMLAESGLGCLGKLGVIVTQGISFMLGSSAFAMQDTEDGWIPSGSTGRNLCLSTVGEDPAPGTFALCGARDARGGRLR